MTYMYMYMYVCTCTCTSKFEWGTLSKLHVHVVACPHSVWGDNGYCKTLAIVMIVIIRCKCYTIVM